MKMLKTVRGIVREGKIDLLEPVNLPESSQVLVTILPQQDEEQLFWFNASIPSLQQIWDNPEDEVYNELIEE